MDTIRDTISTSWAYIKSWEWASGKAKILSTIPILIINLAQIIQAWRGHVWKYIASEVRGSNEQAGNVQLLENYLTYVESSREHRELLARYQGRGERSVEDSARLVGLELPNQSTA